MLIRRKLTLILLCFFFTTVVFAAKGNNPAPHPVITEVHIDTGVNPNLLYISGINFDDPEVWLGDFELPLLLATAVAENLLVAELPAVDYGDYVLSVVQGPNNTKFDDYDLTIGTVGPEGPEGPIGPAGADGLDGADGANGTNGAGGTQGTEGPAGPQGVPGVSGYEVVSTDKQWPAFNVVGQIVFCPPGKEVVGGGYQLPQNWTLYEKFMVGTSAPFHGQGANEIGWHIFAANIQSTPVDVKMYAICVNSL